MMPRRPALLVMFGVFVVAGCSAEGITDVRPAPPRGTLGKDSAIGFSYWNMDKSCEFGCPVMVGTDEPILLDPSPPQDTVIESSDPAVLTANPGTLFSSPGKPTTLSEIRIKAIAPGTVEVRLKKPSGETIERVDLTVAAPARITLEGESNVKVGATITVHALAFAADGARLEAYSGWDFKGDKPSIATVTTPCAPFDHCFYGAADKLIVKGLAAGTLTVSAIGGGTTGTLAVTVAP